MIETDTIKLLRECDAGIKMGISSIADVLDYVEDEVLKKLLTDCKCEHEKLKEDINKLLEKYEDTGKNPNPMLKTAASMKASMKLVMHKSDKTIADLMTEGCNMGIKSLSRYLNEYKAADEVSKDIAKKLIKIEDRLVDNIRKFL